MRTKSADSLEVALSLSERSPTLGVALPMQRVAFVSRGSGADETRRLAAWWEEHLAGPVGLDVTPEPTIPCAMRLVYLRAGEIALGRSQGSISRWQRRQEHIARDAEDRFTLNINRGNLLTQCVTRSGSTPLAGGEAILLDHLDTTDYHCPGGSDVLGVMIPRRILSKALPNAEDLVGTTAPARNEALRLLCNFADGLVEDEGLADPAVLALAGAVLVDLAVLAFGTDRDNGEIARLRGLRAARLQAVLRYLRQNFADPEVTPEVVARRVGISPRYLHRLLQETGVSFSERLYELRLARAFALLTSTGGDPLKVTDAAYAAGFNDLSHFNRLFRRKYGMTPTAVRNRSEASPR